MNDPILEAVGYCVQAMADNGTRVGTPAMMFQVAELVRGLVAAERDRCSQVARTLAVRFAAEQNACAALACYDVAAGIERAG